MRLFRARILPLTLALAVTAPLAAPAAAAELSDVSGLYAESIQTLAQRGIIQGDGTGYYHPEEPLTRAAAASLLYEAFCLVPVFSMEAPAVTNEDGSQSEPVSKEFYSTATTVATLDAVLIPAAPDAVGTWAETIANTVLEARLMEPIDGAFQGDLTMSRSQFALAVMKAVYGADKEIDFLAQGQEDGLLPEELTLDDTVITRGEAALVLDTATKDLTIIGNDCGMATGPHGEEYYGMAKLVHNKQVKRVIATHVGMTPDVGTQNMVEKTLQVDLVPQGSLAEMIRAAGAGLGGVLTPTGVGTIVEDSPLCMGKQTINGKEYLLMQPVHADFAIINGHTVDKFGNVWYKGTTRNFNIVMATAADVVICEADNLVEIGDIEPENVVTSGAFVNYIVDGGNASWKSLRSRALSPSVWLRS